MVIRSVKKLLYSLGGARRQSRRRLITIDRLLDGCLLRRDQGRKRILDVGCSIGKDLVQFLDGREDLEITGLDLTDYGLRQSNFRMLVGDAADIPFPDSHFDATVSIGVLEHIRPMEKLIRVSQEIDRVSKSYVVVVPAISTLIEPHIGRALWQLRSPNAKSAYSGTLIYMSDEAWLALGGFENAKTDRYGHIPLFVRNLIIYKKANSQP